MNNLFDVFGVQWDEFIRAITEGRLQQPFLVRQLSAAGKVEWRLYAVAPKTLVTVNTFLNERRSWRTIDGALSDIERKVGAGFPAMRIFSSAQSVPFDGLVWVETERRLQGDC